MASRLRVAAINFLNPAPLMWDFEHPPRNTELAERYGWINRALPADTLDDFVTSLARRIARFPAAGRAVVKERVNAIALAPVEDFRRDSDLFGEGVRSPEAQKWPWRASSVT